MLSVRGLERYCVKSPSEKISLNFFIFFRFHILRFLSVFCWFMVKITHPSLRDVLMMDVQIFMSLVRACQNSRGRYMLNRIFAGRHGDVP